VSFRQRFEAFLYSRRNIVGTALALGGLALFFTGLVSGPIWLPVVAGLYAIGYLLTPGEQKIDLTLDATADAAEIDKGLDRLQIAITGRVASDILAQVGDIRASIEGTLSTNPTGLSQADQNVFLIRQTALEYLPRALNAYLALPRAYAERRTVANGRTPHDELLAQLQLLNSKMQEVADNIAKRDTDRLMANGRFLQERFAPSSLDVLQPVDEQAQVPTQASAPVPAQQPAQQAQKEQVH
jgi:hypothetical protein